METLAVMARYNPFFEKAGMQKIAESKPKPHLFKAIGKLHALGFEPQMLASQKHNLEKIREIDRRKIINILIQLSRKNAIPRKRILSSNKAYPSHEEFVDKARKLDDEELAAALKKLGFLAQTKIYLFWSQNALKLGHSLRHMLYGHWFQQ